MKQKLTDGLAPGFREDLLTYLDTDPRLPEAVPLWEKIEGVEVGPPKSGFTLAMAVQWGNKGDVKWPQPDERGDFSVPDHLQVARGLRKAQEMFRPVTGGPPPEGGSPTAGGLEDVTWVSEAAA